MVDPSTPSPSADLVRDPAFRRLVRARNGVALALTALTVLVYFGFIFLIAFDKAALGRKLTPHMTAGIPLGVGVILVAVLFTGLYVVWANRAFDPAVREFRSKHGGQVEAAEAGRPRAMAARGEG